MHRNNEISLIIPCFNEAPRIADVIKPALKSKYVDEIIVVDDGSTDGSPYFAAKFKGIKLLKNDKNMGKAFSLFRGAKEASGAVVFFVDGDLRGLKSKHLDDAIERFIGSGLDMLLLPIASGSPFLDFIATLLGSHVLVTGERILWKDKFLKNLKKIHSRFGIEVEINKIAMRDNWKIDLFPFKRGDNFTHPLKTTKMGLWKGVKSEFIMVAEMFKMVGFFEYIFKFNYKFRFATPKGHG